MNITLNSPEIAAVDWETEVIPASDYCRFLATNTIEDSRVFVSSGEMQIPQSPVRQGFSCKALEKQTHHWYLPQDPNLVAINMSLPYDMRDDIDVWPDPLPGLMRYIKDKFTRSDGTSELSEKELGSVRIRYVVTPENIEFFKKEDPAAAEKLKLEAQLHMPKEIAERLCEKVQQEYKHLQQTQPTPDPVLTQAPNANRMTELGKLTR